MPLDGFVRLNPDAEVIARLQATAAGTPAAFVVARFADASIRFATETAGRLAASIGIRWSAIFVFDPECNDVEVARTSEAFTIDPRITVGRLPNNIDADFVVFLDGGALPRTHGLRTLADSLGRAPHSMVAYSDEDRLTDAGVACDPWFRKIPQVGKPLLVPDRSEPVRRR
jgi:hypothetical protein